jgi:predicted NAD/FAD-dependent oxidoreductase
MRSSLSPTRCVRARGRPVRGRAAAQRGSGTRDADLGAAIFPSSHETAAPDLVARLAARIFLPAGVDYRGRARWPLGGEFGTGV